MFKGCLSEFDFYEIQMFWKRNTCFGWFFSMIIFRFKYKHKRFEGYGPRKFAKRISTLTKFYTLPACSNPKIHLRPKKASLLAFHQFMERLSGKNSEAITVVNIMNRLYSPFTLTWLMTFLQTLNFNCFRWLKEKNSTWKSLVINQVRLNGLYLASSQLPKPKSTKWWAKITWLF